MKKIILIISFIQALYLTINAQVNNTDFNRIILNTYIPNNLPIPVESQKVLESKLNQICSNYGIGGSQNNNKFVITASLNIGTKDIIAGPPQLIAQNIEVILFIGNALDKTIYSNLSLNLKGVGTNDTKAINDALNNINTKNNTIESFLNIGKNKIVSFYANQCDLTIKDAETLSNKGSFEEAIYKLALVPNTCEACYEKALKSTETIYKKMVDYNGKKLLNNAKLKWNSSQNLNGAEEASHFLSLISPFSSSFNDANSLVEIISKKVNEIEKKEWEFKLKQYSDSLELDKIRLKASQEVALEYIKKQPQTIVYTNLNWK